jgi:excisionase family DNA binding protein
MSESLSNPAPGVDPDPPCRWLTCKQAAKRIGKGQKIIRDAVRAKHLRAAFVGGKKEILIHESWLWQWLESSSREPVETTRATPMRVAR